ncbi:hypothetical protein V7x_31520 [Crateriforma conspicua]|uniref:Uncharacterized protein n=1 Tax=Crateriforma conspicua TaxID=2527996 RepID=A0A5C6FX53_9PLAN|nr:hypothetical protein [Crateriforma conspicua]TWU67577.1 hypothetical protein V7x_31520 [Crateriforma conspicua]
MDPATYSAKPGDLAELFVVRGERRIDKLAKATQPSAPLPRHRPGERFIRGPIPMAWFKPASTCGGRAEAVAVLLWYAAGFQRRNPVKLSPTVLRELNVHPKTARRVLIRMAKLGLVRNEFSRGRSPIVTITMPDAAPMD